MHTSLSIGPTEGSGIIDSILVKSCSVLLEYVCSCKKAKFGLGSLNDPNEHHLEGFSMADGFHPRVRTERLDISKTTLVPVTTVS